MKSNNILSIFLAFIIGVFVFFVGINVNSEELPNRIYKVYLNGQTLGTIDSKETLLNIIDEKQQGIKERYGVDKVYPPNGLEIKEEYTYSTDIKDASYIYEKISDEDPFTISGYAITIKYPEESVGNHEEPVKKDPVTIYVLNKEAFEEAFITVMKAFLSPEAYELYISEGQPEILDVGSRIESVYWEESITIKKTLIDVNAQILTNVGDISKYLFFGTLKDQTYYTVREGDNIELISEAYNLNPDEFLVANPEFTSKNVLLTPGQKVNVSLIKPLVTIVSEVHMVEDITDRYKTEYVDDKTAYSGTQKTTQEGSNGLKRVTEKILYKNGEIHQLLIVSTQDILPTVNKIVARGTKGYGGGTYYNTGGNDDWSWPTNTPYIITSRFAPRWGKHHDGIDISGTGHGSPIRAVQGGTVIRSEYWGSYGYMIAIAHPSGYVTMYAHMMKQANFSVGKVVKREQIIGYMGNTGFSTGTHLHFEIRKGSDLSGTKLDPCKSIFKC